jgi:hypothetical protein
VCEGIKVTFYDQNTEYETQHEGENKISPTKSSSPSSENGAEAGGMTHDDYVRKSHINTKSER